MNATPRPERIEGRSDAAQLWLHLLQRGILFDCDADPAEWSDGEGRRALADREVATVRRLVAEVDRLGGEAFDCYADAQAMRQLAVLGSLPKPPQPELVVQAARLPERGALWSWRARRAA